MSNKKKVAVYVDGFNLYHGLENLSKPHFQWLDLKSLAEKHIDHQIDVIEILLF